MSANSHETPASTPRDQRGHGTEVGSGPSGMEQTDDQDNLNNNVSNVAEGQADKDKPADKPGADSGRAGRPAMTVRAPRPPAPAAPDTGQQVDDAVFLERQFDMMPREAAALIARNGLDRRDLEDKASDSEGQPLLPDALEGKPIPSGPPTEITTDTDEQARKPVVHDRNNRQGAG